MKKLQITTPKKINDQYTINKQAIDVVLNKADTIKTNDLTRGKQIKPFLPVAICDNLIYQNVLLNKCISTLAEDTVYNDISLTSKLENVDEIKVELIKDFWVYNQDELVKQITDWYSYGFGGAELLYDTNGEPAGLSQIQADTLYILRDEYQGNTIYYAVQQINGVDKVRMRLHDRLSEYPEKDNELPICFWLGGGRKSDFFDYPCWISCFNQVSASVTLDILNTQKINDGNLVSGILLIKRPPTPLNTETTDAIDDSLEEKMQQHGNSIFTLELTTLNPNIPLEVDYIQISESNYDYLLKLGEEADSKILTCFKIPKARLLIDDTTESMNSNKTNTLYKIYSIELNNLQRPLEIQMSKFNYTFFEFNGYCEIETPVFVDEKDVEAQTTINLFNNGLITLGQAVKNIGKIFPAYNTETISEDNPIYYERYYNGNPLGFADGELDNPITDVGDLIDYIKIN